MKLTIKSRDSKMEEIQILALKIKTQIVLLIKIKKDGNRDFEKK